MAAKPNPKRERKSAPFAIEDSWPKMTREMRLLSDIHPYPNNPRKHPPEQVAFLGELIRKYGPDQDIVVDAEDDMILKGHGRRLAALLIGLHEFPVTVRHGLTPDQKIAMRIQDNQVSLMSGWDQDLIRGEIMLLKTTGFDLPLLGFGDSQIVQFTTTPGPPAQFQAVGEDIETNYCCPKCGFSWSGNPKPGAGSGEDDQVRVRVRGNARSEGSKRATEKVSSASSRQGKKTVEDATEKPKSSYGKMARSPSS